MWVAALFATAFVATTVMAAKKASWNVRYLAASAVTVVTSIYFVYLIYLGNAADGLAGVGNLIVGLFVGCVAALFATGTFIAVTIRENKKVTPRPKMTHLNVDVKTQI